MYGSQLARWFLNPPLTDAELEELCRVNWAFSFIAAHV
jgi:hypothetical protein